MSAPVPPLAIVPPLFVFDTKDELVDCLQQWAFFRWVLNVLKSVFNLENDSPVYLTERALALCNAIEIELPRSCHLLFPFENRRQKPTIQLSPGTQLHQCNSVIVNDVSSDDDEVEEIAERPGPVSSV
ncbi:hypothetical protein GEMRC1_000060 [Eukaryota sp. GEM-RC1]